MNIQVDSSHYDFGQYIDIYRWNSYFIQIQEILNSQCEEIALVGIGDGLVPKFVQTINDSINFITIDFDASLKPDICADILSLSTVMSRKVKCIVCCQVLEHLPFEKFDRALGEIYKCLEQDGVFILSLPDSGTTCEVKIHFPKIHFVKNPIKLCLKNKDFKFDGEHYWEVNASMEYRNKIIKQKFESFFDLERSFLVPNNTYHRFYIGRKREVI